MVLLPLRFRRAFLFFSTCRHIFFAANRATGFQKLTHIHLKIFFKLTRWLIPRTKFTIQDEVRRIHSSVIVCNHLSYLASYFAYFASAAAPDNS